MYTLKFNDKFCIYANVLCCNLMDKKAILVCDDTPVKTPCVKAEIVFTAQVFDIGFGASEYIESSITKEFNNNSSAK